MQFKFSRDKEYYKIWCVLVFDQLFSLQGFFWDYVLVIYIVDGYYCIFIVLRLFDQMGGDKEDYVSFFVVFFFIYDIQIQDFNWVVNSFNGYFFV